MSKSLGNYIGIDEPPGEMYGKVMSLPDELMVRYFELVTPVPLEEVRAIAAGLASGELHPRDVKMRLAREIVVFYHGKEAALKAEEEFKRVFQQRELPEEIPVFEVNPALLEEGAIWLPRLLHVSGLVPSTSEGRRLIQQGGVKVDGEKVVDPSFKLVPADGMVIRVGKRKFLRLKCT